MRLFPFISPPEIDIIYPEYPLYSECAWDFKTDRAIFNDGNPKIVFGNEAIKVWVYKAIKTVRYQHEIYSWDYGCEIESLLGKRFNIGFIQSEAKRFIREALSINPYITNISKIDVNFEDDDLLVKVELESIYGSLDVLVKREVF